MTKPPSSPSQSEHSIPSFSRSLPMALLRARDAAMLHFRPIFASQDLTEQQWRVIRALYDLEALEISNLARACHILLPSMSGIIKRLEARGLIQRSSKQQDQRSSLVSLTDEARALIEYLAPQLEARYQEIERRFDQQRLEQLYQLCFELEAVLSED